MEGVWHVGGCVVMLYLPLKLWQPLSYTLQGLGRAGRAGGVNGEMLQILASAPLKRLAREREGGQL